MKKHLDFHLLCLSVAAILLLSFLAAAVPFWQTFTRDTFSIGFPFAFFRIRVGHDFAFSTHFSLAALAGDVVLGYALCKGIQMLSPKLKKKSVLHKK